jgi:hypothetical protein
MQNKLTAGIISLYLAAFLYTQVPFVKTLTLVKGADQLFWNHLAIFAIFLVPIFIIVSKYIDSEPTFGALGYIKLLLLLVAVVGIIITIFYRFVPVESVYQIPSGIEKYFVSDLSFTIWLIAPLIILFF